jgi:uroporphyrinogen-III synthase
MPRAILLKTRNTPEDPYDTAFRSKTPFIPVFIPVLQHAKVNAPELRNILQNDPQNHYTALIITSQRAVEALNDAMSSLTGTHTRETTLFKSRMLIRV